MKLTPYIESHEAKRSYDISENCHLDSKITGATTTINAIAESEVLRKIETAVILELHEKINISALITNAESWSLSKGERNTHERIEIQAMKYLFDLPPHTHLHPL